MDTLKRLKIFRKTRSTVEDPQKSCRSLLIYLNRFLKGALGMDILDVDFSYVNPQFILLLTMIVTFMYSDIESAVLANNIGEFAYNIAVFGFGLQGMAKLEVYFFRKVELIKVLQLLEDYLKQCRRDEQWKQIMIDSVTVSMMICKSFIIMYEIIFFFLTFFGLIMSLLSGEWQLSFGFKFSFIDTTEWAGYIFTYLYQTTASLMTVVSSSGNDCLIVIVYVNAFGMFDSIIADVRKLGRISQLEKNSENLREAVDQIKEVIQKHQNVLEYLNLANDIYRTYFCMSLVSMTGTISILLIALVWHRWYPALLLSFMASVQLFAMCILGTLLLLKGEELEREIYAITWYDLDVSVQKSLKLLLCASQTTKEISYRFGVMNMETYVQTHKLIYSFFAMLVTTKE